MAKLDSKPGSGKAQTEWQQCLELEKRLVQSLRKKSFYDVECRQLRASLRASYESLLFLDPAFASANEVEQALWKSVFYKPIEEFRARVRQAEKAGDVGREQLPKVATAFLKFLEDASLFYRRLIMRLQSVFGDVGVKVELPQGLAHGGPGGHGSHSPGSSMGSAPRDVRPSVHRCLIYLGDIARYQSQTIPKVPSTGSSTTSTSNAGRPDWNRAAHYYKLAARVFPRSGNPFNQLAVMAYFTGDELRAVYYYFRSLSVGIPFMTARENLMLLFEQNRARYTQLQDDGVAGSVAAAASNVAVRFVRLAGLLFDRINMDEYISVFNKAFAALQAFMDHPGTAELLSRQPRADATPMHLVILSIFTVHNVDAHAGSRGAQDGGAQPAVLRASYGETLQRSMLKSRALSMLFRCGATLCDAALAWDADSSPAAPAAMIAANVLIQWLAAQPHYASTDVAHASPEEITCRTKFWAAAAQLAAHLVNTTPAPQPSSANKTGSWGEWGSFLGGGALPEELELLGFEPLRSRHHWQITDVGKAADDEALTRATRLLQACRAVANGLVNDTSRAVTGELLAGSSVDMADVRSLEAAVTAFASTVLPGSNAGRQSIAASQTSQCSGHAAAEGDAAGVTPMDVDKQQQHPGAQHHAHDAAGSDAGPVGNGAAQSTDAVGGAAHDAVMHEHNHVGDEGDVQEEEEVIVFQPKSSKHSRMSSPAGSMDAAPSSLLHVDNTPSPGASGRPSPSAAAGFRDVHQVPGTSGLGSGSQLAAAAAADAAPPPPLPQALLASSHQRHSPSGSIGLSVPSSQPVATSPSPKDTAAGTSLPSAKGGDHPPGPSSGMASPPEPDTASHQQTARPLGRIPATLLSAAASAPPATAAATPSSSAMHPPQLAIRSASGQQAGISNSLQSVPISQPGSPSSLRTHSGPSLLPSQQKPPQYQGPPIRQHVSPSSSALPSPSFLHRQQAAGHGQVPGPRSSDGATAQLTGTSDQLAGLAPSVTPVAPQVDEQQLQQNINISEMLQARLLSKATTAATTGRMLPPHVPAVSAPYQAAGMGTFPASYVPTLGTPPPPQHSSFPFAYGASSGLQMLPPAAIYSQPPSPTINTSFAATSASFAGPLPLGSILGNVGYNTAGLTSGDMPTCYPRASLPGVANYPPSLPQSYALLAGQGNSRVVSYSPGLGVGFGDNMVQPSLPGYNQLDQVSSAGPQFESLPVHNGSFVHSGLDPAGFWGVMDGPDPLLGSAAGDGNASLPAGVFTASEYGLAPADYDEQAVGQGPTFLSAEQNIMSGSMLHSGEHATAGYGFGPSAIPVPIAGGLGVEQDLVGILHPSGASYDLEQTAKAAVDSILSPDQGSAGFMEGLHDHLELRQLHASRSAQAGVPLPSSVPPGRSGIGTPSDGAATPTSTGGLGSAGLGFNLVPGDQSAYHTRGSSEAEALPPKGKYEMFGGRDLFAGMRHHRRISSSGFSGSSMAADSEPQSPSYHNADPFAAGDLTKGHVSMTGLKPAQGVGGAGGSSMQGHGSFAAAGAPGGLGNGRAAGTGNVLGSELAGLPRGGSFNGQFGISSVSAAGAGATFGVDDTVTPVTAVSHQPCGHHPTPYNPLQHQQQYQQQQQQQQQPLLAPYNPLTAPVQAPHVMQQQQQPGRDAQQPSSSLGALFSTYGAT
eukprot:jgi/Chrzof1/5902/Cz16g20030.t1